MDNNWFVCPKYDILYFWMITKQQNFSTPFPTKNSCNMFVSTYVSLNFLCSYSSRYEISNVVFFLCFHFSWWLEYKGKFCPSKVAQNKNIGNMANKEIITIGWVLLKSNAGTRYVNENQKYLARFVTELLRASQTLFRVLSENGNVWTSLSLA